MLEISKLSVNYKSGKESVHALGPISIKITDGDIYAVIGPSGCGKSTLLHVLSGIVKSYDGEVLFNGEALSPSKQNIGLIPQNFGLLPWKDVQKNLTLSLAIKKKASVNSIRERMDYILNKLNICTLLNRYPSELSGGQKQRVAIGRAFIMEPDFLLMDEPFSALDAITREEAQDLFIDIWNKYQTTTVFVTHSIEEAIYMGKKIVIMSNCPGNIIEVIHNPLFNTPELRQNPEFFKLSAHIRNIIKKGWKV